MTTFGGRVLVLYWGGRVFLTTFGGRVLTVGVELWKASGGSCPGWAGKIFGPNEGWADTPKSAPIEVVLYPCSFFNIK